MVDAVVMTRARSLRRASRFRVMARVSAVARLADNHHRSITKRRAIPLSRIVVESSVQSPPHRRNRRVATVAVARARQPLCPRGLLCSGPSTAPTPTRCGPTVASKRYPISGKRRILPTKKRLARYPYSRYSARVLPRSLDISDRKHAKRI